jgi:hypothetical protein
LLNSKSHDTAIGQINMELLNKWNLKYGTLLEKNS